MKRIKYRKRRIPKYFYLISIGLFLFLGVGYSTLNSTFGVEGSLATTTNTWDIRFKNIDYSLDNVATASTVAITNNTSLSFDVTLSNPGDKYEFTFDIENEGNLDAMIKSVEMDDLTETQKGYLTYSLTYSDGTEISEGDLLKVSEIRNAHFLVEYKRLLDTDIYPENDTVLNLGITINYYYPMEEKYNVSLDLGGTISNYRVSNLEQQLVINDLEVSNDYKFAICDNGVRADINSQNKLVLNNVKSDATCTLKTDLSSLPYNANVTVTLIRDVTQSSIVYGQAGRIYDLNGKTWTFTVTGDYALYNYGGTLSIKDSVGTGQVISSNKYLIYNNGTLNILGGTYTHNYADSDGAVVYATGTINLANSSFSSENSPAIYIKAFNTSYNNSEESLVNINRSNVESENSVGIITDCAYSEIHVKNSTIDAATNAIDLGATKASHLYLCNSTITNATNDFFISNSGISKLFYSSNTTFTNNTHVPTTLSQFSTNAILSSDACAE